MNGQDGRRDVNREGAEVMQNESRRAGLPHVPWLVEIRMK
jgi:hypothetical protein